MKGIEDIIQQDIRHSQQKWEDAIKDKEKKFKETVKDLDIIQLNRNAAEASKRIQELKITLDMIQFEIKNLPTAKFTQDVEYDMYLKDEYIKLMKNIKRLQLDKDKEQVQKELEVQEIKLDILMKRLKRF